MNEGRGANLQAVGLPSSVADDVEPQLALGGLGPAVDLPLRGLKTLGEQLELLDHAGQVIEDLVLGGQRHARHVGHDRPVGNLLQELLDHVPALPHLLDADPVPVVCVAVLADRHAPLALAVRGVGLELAQVIVHAGPAQRRPAQSEVDGILGRDHRHALGAGEPDPVGVQEGDVLVQLRREVVAELAQLFDQVRREVPLDTADPVPARGQPRPAELVEEVQEDLPVAEGVEEHRHRADVQRLRAKPEQVPDDPLHLGHDRAQVLRARRHF